MYKDLSKQKNKGRKKKLNIYNTDKYYNLDLISNSEQGSLIPITPFNVDKIHMDLAVTRNSENWLTMDKPRFIYYVQSMLDPNISNLIDIIEMGADVTYFTRFPVPDNILDAFAKQDTGRILFQFPPSSYPKELKRQFVLGVKKAYEATEVNFDCIVIMPDIAPVDVVSALSYYGSSVDNVRIDFPPLHGEELRDFEKSYYYLEPGNKELWHCYPKDMFGYVKKLQRPLSSWGMQIQLTYHSKMEYDALTALIKADRP